MKIIYYCVCLAALVGVVLPAPAPADGFVFPDDRQQRKLEPIITPPVLPVLEHLERDPSTLLPNETNGRQSPGQVKPRFGFGGGFNVAPSSTGGLTASISSSAGGGGSSQSASQSFSFGFNEGFSASHSASQAASFSSGFGSGFNGFSGSQASSQAASFGAGGTSVSGAASSAAAFGGNSGSQSASSAFGFNSLNGFQPEPSFGEDVIDIRHRGVPNFPFPTFPTFPSFGGQRKGVGAAAFRSGKSRPSQRSNDDFFAILVSD